MNFKHTGDPVLPVHDAGLYIMSRICLTQWTYPRRRAQRLGSIVMDPEPVEQPKTDLMCCTKCQDEQDPMPEGTLHVHLQNLLKEETSSIKAVRCLFNTEVAGSTTRIDHSFSTG